jgi:hypothetical protein
MRKISREQLNNLLEMAKGLYNPTFLNSLSKKNLDIFLKQNKELIESYKKVQFKSENRKKGASKAKMTKFINKIKNLHNKEIPKLKEFVDNFVIKRPKK